jgi:hypothetical protein
MRGPEVDAGFVLRLVFVHRDVAAVVEGAADEVAIDLRRVWVVWVTAGRDPAIVVETVESRDVVILANSPSTRGR